MIINEVEKIVRQAGEMFAERDFEVDTKTSVSDKVTSMDLKIEKYLKENLLNVVKGSGFMGEESEGKDLDNEYVWIVDPIDGTTNFVRDFRISCVSVALMQNNEVVLGMVYNSYADELFRAEKGKGAYLNDKQISVSQTPFENSILLSSPHPYFKEESKLMFSFLEEIYNSIDDMRRSGSAAIDLCNLACGRGDISFKMVLCPWDYAAAVLIIREAGGVVGTTESNEFGYRKSIPVISANNHKNYDRLCGIVSKYYK